MRVLSPSHHDWTQGWPQIPFFLQSLPIKFSVLCFRTWEKPWVNSLLFLTALIKWITVVWAVSTKVTLFIQPLYFREHWKKNECQLVRQASLKFYLATTSVSSSEIVIWLEVVLPGPSPIGLVRIKFTCLIGNFTCRGRTGVTFASSVVKLQWPLEPLHLVGVCGGDSWHFKQLKMQAKICWMPRFK